MMDSRKTVPPVTITLLLEREGKEIKTIRAKILNLPLDDLAEWRQKPPEEIVKEAMVRGLKTMQVNMDNGQVDLKGDSYD